MPIKILVINSSAKKNNLLMNAFAELGQKNFSFDLRSSTAGLINQFKKIGWPAKKIYLGPILTNKFKLLVFLAVFLPLQLKFFFSLSYLKYKRRIDTMVCLGFNEKILLTLPARALRIKIIWLEDTDIIYRQIGGLLLWLFKANHRLAETALFSHFSKLQLESLGFKADRLALVPPGTKSSQYQENIFNKLAASGSSSFHRKYFTVGVITKLNQRQKIETIFQAMKICLPVIANLQLIIVGDGEERKNLIWLAKKMEIENLVWLVGEQEQLKKWLDSFDIFLVAGGFQKLDDFGHILEAMATGLPVLGPRNVGLEDLVIENKTGSLIETNNNEMLARQIIKLHQDKKLRAFLGNNGRERVEQLFTLGKMLAALEPLLKK